jgi:hypothetical protein
MQPEIDNEHIFENMTEILMITFTVILLLIIGYFFMHRGVKGGIVPALLFILLS